MTVQKAAEKVKGSAFRSWPVTSARGVVGVLSYGVLEKALTDGEMNRTLAEFMEGRDFPHVHADHPLTLALERMGATQLDTNVHELEGVVTVPDFLNTYGLGGTEKPV